MTMPNNHHIDRPPWHEHLTPPQQVRLEQLLDETEDGERASFEAFFDDPVGQIDTLRNDPDLQRVVAWADVLPRLLGWFTPSEEGEVSGWSQDRERSGPVGATSVCVTWSFSGSYPVRRLERRGDDLVEVLNTSFNDGVQALGQAVELHGVTFMGVDATEFRLRRYVDWAGLYTQLGLTLNWRVPTEEAAAPT